MAIAFLVVLPTIRLLTFTIVSSLPDCPTTRIAFVIQMRSSYKTTAPDCCPFTVVLSYSKQSLKTIYMKRQIISVTSKFLLGLVFFAGVIAARAQSSGNEPSEKERAGVVKYLGAQDAMVLFNVSFKNPEGKKFSVIVLDQDNVQLFQRVYSERNFEKNFKFPQSDKDKLTFIIRNFKDADIAQSFAINVKTRFVEDIAIRKVN
jgi:hypothetical protein